MSEADALITKHLNDAHQEELEHLKEEVKKMNLNSASKFVEG